MKLGVVGRAAVVASVLLFTGVTYKAYSAEMDWRYGFVIMNDRICENGIKTAPENEFGTRLQACFKSREAGFEEAGAKRKDALAAGVAWGFVALLGAWAAFGLTYGVARWILNGRK